MKGNGEHTMRAAGWSSGVGAVVVEVRGQKLAILASRRLVEVDLPPGEPVALGAGPPTVLMADGSAHAWSMDRRRWEPLGSMRMEPVTLKSKEPEVSISIERAPRRPQDAVLIRMVRGYSDFKQGQTVEVTREAALRLQEQGYCDVLEEVAP